MPPLTEQRPSTEERVSRIEGAQPHLATKADVAEAEARIARQIAESETRTNRQIAESEARLTKQIAESDTRMIRWMLTFAAFGIAAITVMYRLFG